MLNSIESQVIGIIPRRILHWTFRVMILDTGPFTTKHSACDFQASLDDSSIKSSWSREYKAISSFKAIMFWVCAWNADIVRPTSKNSTIQRLTAPRVWRQALYMEVLAPTTRFCLDTASKYNDFSTASTELDRSISVTFIKSTYSRGALFIAITL